MNVLQKIVTKALREEQLTFEELVFLLGLDDNNGQQLLFEAARVMRQRYFENTIALYGFVYFSTYCRNDCTFCFYRRSNSSCERYRKSTAEIVAASVALAESGVHLIDLTMGEDPVFLEDGERGFARLIDIVSSVRGQTSLPIMISPGVVPDHVLRDLQDAGATWYACYQETHNRELFEKLRLRQSYDERWQAKRHARDLGMLVEEGVLVGVGDQVHDAVHSLLAMRELGADQVRAMTFVPQTGTPLATSIPGTSRKELNLIAIMRLLFPISCIPASLDVEGIQGLKNRLNAGANVVTSIIPPMSGLYGVSQSTLDIAEGYRTVAGVLPLLAECGLEPASRQEYGAWLDRLSLAGMPEVAA